MALTAAGGVHLLYTGMAFGWTRPRWSGPVQGGGHASGLVTWGRRRLDLIGLRDLDLREAGAVAGALFLVGAVAAFALFGGVVPAAVSGVFAAGLPAAAHRRRARAQATAAQDAWPRLVDEIRILTGSVGRSIPQALFEAGRNGPPELRPSFEAAHREWRLSTDFERTLSLLKHQLRDATADAVCETLLIAHDLGGTDLDRRLEDLAVDRRAEIQFRKDARARQAGVRFARRFVLFVPLGMAFAGLSVGNGRAAYATTTGQVLVVAALVMVMVCWIWAGRFLRLPETDRVFDR